MSIHNLINFPALDKYFDAANFMGKVKFKTLLKGFAHRQVQNMGHLRTESDFVQGTKPMLLRLAIPRFWSNARAPWKTGFSHQVTS